MEAFSDGVIAIVITLLVLELHVPDLGAAADNSAMLQALIQLSPALAAYVISFLVCAVWWVSHHNLIHDLDRVDRLLLWANNLFLLWLAFLPFPTALLGRHPGQPVATALYGAVASLAGFSFWLMRWHAAERGRLMKPEIGEVEIRRRVRIGLVSPVLYAVAAAASFLAPIVSLLIYGLIPAYFALAFMGGRQGVSPPKQAGSQ